MKFTPYWLDTSPAGPDRSGTEVGGDVDVAVVGAGLTGVSAALHLARKGAKVAVFERETVAWGASGRNGGMATPGLAIGFRDAIARYGFPTASTLYLTYYDAIDTIEKLVGEEGIDCDFARTGKMNLASKPAHLDGLRKTHDVLAERLGCETQMVPKSELRTEIGSDYYHGAMIDPKGAGLHVGKFTRGLAEAAARTGAQIHEKAPVLEVKRLGGTRHEVITPRGSVRADQVLVATSGYTEPPVPVAAAADRAGRQLHHRHRAARQGGLRPAPAQPPDGVGHQEPPVLLPDHARPAAAVRRPGAVRDVQPRVGREERADPAARRWSRSSRSWPSARVDYCWGGQVDMSLDRMVHAGEHDGLYYSVGYSGHGVQMATYMGKQMAEYMNGVPEANPWRDLTFKRIPGHVGPPWFLPFAGAYYKFQDVIK